MKAKGIHYYKCNSKGCNCNRNAEPLHEQFTSIFDQYTLKSEPLVPLIEKQMLATYYKYNEEKDDDKLTFKKRLKEIDGDIAWQKERLKKGEIPYELYLEFVADFKRKRRQ